MAFRPLAKSRRASASAPDRGQALVEFSLILIPFLVLLMAIVDGGRALYMYNGASQAAREIARVTSVYPCDPSNCVLGNHAKTAAVIATQKRLVPGLASPAASIAVQCTNMVDTSLPNAGCRSGDFVRVSVTIPFQVLTPVISMFAPSTLSSTTHIQIP